MNLCEYARPHQPHNKKTVIRCMVAAALLLCLICLVRESHYAIARIRLMRLASICGNYRASHDSTVYEASSERAQTLLRSESLTYVKWTSPTWTGPIVGRKPPSCWTELRKQLGLPPINPDGETTVFLHSRRAPSGREAIVAVDAGWGLPRSVWEFKITVIGSLSYKSGPSIQQYCMLSRDVPGLTALDEPCFLTGDVRFLAGQPDPSETSRFTIAFEVEKDRILIDGQLNDDHTVILQLREPGKLRAHLKDVMR